MKNILILNGPNLNMLGTREPDIYGHQTLDDIKVMCLEYSKSVNFSIEFKQSNHEGQIVDWIQDAFKNNINGIIINAAAYTHTSVAIHDALKLMKCPIIEVHLSNPKDREKFRHTSYIEPIATDIFAGFGANGYIMALKKLKEVL